MGIRNNGLRSGQNRGLMREIMTDMFFFCFFIAAVYFSKSRPPRGRVGTPGGRLLAGGRVPTAGGRLGFSGSDFKTATFFCFFLGFLIVYSILRCPISSKHGLPPTKRFFYVISLT